MATTSGNLTAGKAVTGRLGNGNGGRYGLKAKLAAGMAVLGCAAALAFGGLRVSENAQSSAAAPVVTAPQAMSREQLLFREQNLWLPMGALPVATASFEAQRFLEQNLWLPSGVTAPIAPSGLGPQEYLPGEGPAAGGVGTAGLGTGVGAIEYLPGEEPSTGDGTLGGDSSPCPPLQPCPR